MPSNNDYQHKIYLNGAWKQHIFTDFDVLSTLFELINERFQWDPQIEPNMSRVYKKQAGLESVL